MLNMKMNRWLIFSLLSLISVFGQNIDQNNFVYYLPFPGTNNTALVDWQFSLELYPQDGKAAHIRLVQLEYGGKSAAVLEKDMLENEGVFNWSFRFQSTSLKQGLCALSPIRLCWVSFGELITTVELTARA